MKKILALVITLVIFSALSVPCGAVGDTTVSQWIPVSFSSSISTDTQNKMMIKWDWNDLLKDAAASGENLELAIAGLVMSNQAEFSKEDVEDVLNTIGFADVSSEYYSTDTNDTSLISNPARTFAHRQIDVNGEKSISYVL